MTLRRLLPLSRPRARARPGRAGRRRPGRGRDRPARRRWPPTAAGRRGRATTSATGRYTLMVAAPGQPAAPARISTSSRPFDVALGPDATRTSWPSTSAAARAAATSAATAPAAGSDVKLSTVSSPSYKRGHAGHLGLERRLHAPRQRLRRPVRQGPRLVGLQPPAAEEQVPADRPGPRLDPRHAGSSSARST